MKIKVNDANGIHIVSIQGEVNLDSSPEMRKVFDGIVSRGSKKVIVDFEGVSYIDSSGLATMIEMLQRVKGYQGHMALAHISDKVRGILEITKLDQLFSIYPSKEDAIASFP